MDRVVKTTTLASRMVFLGISRAIGLVRLKSLFNPRDWASLVSLV